MSNQQTGRWVTISGRRVFIGGTPPQLAPKTSDGRSSQRTLGGKRIKDMSLDEAAKHTVFFRIDNDNGLFPEGYTLMYFMDSPQAKADMAAGKIPYVMVPRGTGMSGGSPITDIWKKKFSGQPGQQHILGMAEGITSEKGIFIDMLTVREQWRRSGIATHMVNIMKHNYPDAPITHSNATQDGKAFLQKRGLYKPRKP